MQNYLYESTLYALNRTRRMFGARWIKPGKFGMETPDDGINRMFVELESEMESRLSLPFGLRIMKTRWLQSAMDASHASATESAIASQFISWFDTELAVEIIDTFLENQASEGNIPLLVKPLSISSIPAPAVFTETVLRLNRLSVQQELPAIFEKLEKFSNWLILHKKEPDGLYSHNDREWFAEDPHAHHLRAEFPETAAPTTLVRSVALNSSIAFQLQCVSQIARLLKLDKEAKKYDEYAKQLCDNIIANLWDEPEGFFMDRVGDRTCRTAPLSGFMTLAADIPTKAQSVKMLARLQRVHDRLNILIQRPDLAPAFLTVADGLAKYGHRKESAELALAAIRYTQSLGKAPKFFLPRIVSMLLLARNIIGFHQFDDRYVLYPCLPDAWAGGTVRIRNPRLSHNIFMSLKENGKVECRIISSAGQLANTTIDNYSFHNFPFKA